MSRKKSTTRTHFTLRIETATLEAIKRIAVDRKITPRAAAKECLEYAVSRYRPDSTESTQAALEQPVESVTTTGSATPITFDPFEYLELPSAEARAKTVELPHQAASKDFLFDD